MVSGWVGGNVVIDFCYSLALAKPNNLTFKVQEENYLSFLVLIFLFKINFPCIFNCKTGVARAVWILTWTGPYIISIPTDPIGQGLP